MKFKVTWEDATYFLSGCVCGLVIYIIFKPI